MRWSYRTHNSCLFLLLRTTSLYLFFPHFRPATNNLFSLNTRFACTEITFWHPQNHQYQACIPRVDVWFEARVPNSQLARVCIPDSGLNGVLHVILGHTSWSRQTSRSSSFPQGSCGSKLWSPTQAAPPSLFK